MHIDVTIYTVFIPRIWFQVSTQPPAKKTAGQIEKETDERRTSNIERPTSNNEFCQFY
jgi:hypothetical protein